MAGQADEGLASFTEPYWLIEKIPNADLPRGSLLPLRDRDNNQFLPVFTTKETAEKWLAERQTRDPKSDYSGYRIIDVPAAELADILSRGYAHFNIYKYAIEGSMDAVFASRPFVDWVSRQT